MDDDEKEDEDDEDTEDADDDGDDGGEDDVEDDEVQEDDVVDVAEDEVEVDDVEDEDDDVEEEGRSQDPDPHFVRACAVEMHLDISQEPLCAKNCWPNVTDQNRDADFERACAVMDMSPEPFHAAIS